MDCSNRLVELPYTFFEVKNSIKENLLKSSKTFTRTISIALPFIGLYKPIGNIISYGTGIIKIYSHLYEIKETLHQNGFSVFIKPVLLNAFEVSILAGAIFRFKLANIIIHSMNLVSQFKQFINAIKENDKKAAFEYLLKMISSVINLTLLYRGSLKNSFVSLIFEALIQTYEGGLDWKNGNKPESLSKFLMAAVKIHQSYKIYELMQLQLKLYDFFYQGINNSKNTQHLKNTELMTKAEIIKTDAKGNEYYFGEHYHGYGKGMVKGMNLEFRSETINGQEMRVLNFKVNHVFRRELEVIIQKYKSVDNQKLNRMFNRHFNNINGVEIATTKETFVNLKTEIHKFSLKGFGTIKVGSDINCKNLYNYVQIEMDKNQDCINFNQLLSLLHLDSVFHKSSIEDIERLKIGHLFRSFHPKEAFYLERDKKFFDLSTSELKKEIIEKVPEMESVFEKHLHTMQKTEILPGRMRYTIPELSNIAKNYGGGALVSTIINNKSNDQLIQTTLSILKMGLFSSEVRFSHGINIHGLSSVRDFYSGGADSVFTQYVTRENLRNLNRFGYCGKIRLIFSLDLLDTGTYQYQDDNYGYRTIKYPKTKNMYVNRLNIFDFVINQSGSFSGNEVMVKEAIPENKIVGVWVRDEETKLKLVDQMRKQGLVQKDRFGKEIFNNKPLNQFIIENKRKTCTIDDCN